MNGKSVQVPIESPSSSEASWTSTSKEDSALYHIKCYIMDSADGDQEPSNNNHRENVKKISPEKKFECEICKRRFARKSYVKSHEEVHRNKDERRVFECHRCKKKYLRRRSLERHWVKNCWMLYPAKYSTKSSKDDFNSKTLVRMEKTEPKNKTKFVCGGNIKEKISHSKKLPSGKKGSFKFKDDGKEVKYKDVSVDEVFGVRITRLLENEENNERIKENPFCDNKGRKKTSRKTGVMTNSIQTSTRISPMPSEILEKEDNEQSKKSLKKTLCPQSPQNVNEEMCNVKGSLEVNAVSNDDVSNTDKKYLVSEPSDQELLSNVQEECQPEKKTLCKAFYPINEVTGKESAEIDECQVTYETIYQLPSNPGDRHMMEDQLFIMEDYQGGDETINGHRIWNAVNKIKIKM